MPHITPWRAIAEALASEGVGRVYGLPGNPLHLVADLVEHTEIDIVLMRHEHSGVSCAYAESRISRRPAVAFGNPGPGITNMATGLLEASSASLPVIVLSNGTPLESDGKGAFQELDSVAHLTPVTKWATRIVDPATTPWVMARAFDVAVNGRPGPVFIDVPSDIGLREVDMPAYRPSLGRHRSRPAADALAAAAELAAAAKRPLIWCGSGAYSSGAADEVMTFAEALGAPVFTTPGGRGIIAEDHELALGQTGLYFTEAGKSLFDSADLVIAVGTRLEEFSTGGWSYWPGHAKFIQIDIDPQAIALNQRPDVALVGDAALALADLHSALTPIDDSTRAARRDAIAALKGPFLARVDAECAEQHRPIRARQVVAAINRVFGRDTIMVHENGGADLWSYYWPYYKVLDVGDDIPMGEQTAMGMGIIGTIAAKLARPDKQVVCVTGDSAMQMAMMEMATAAERRCGVTWIVLNNQALGWPQYLQVLTGKQEVATNFLVGTDFVAVARAQGCEGRRIEDPAELEAGLADARDANRKGVPFVLDITIEKHDYPPHFVQHHKAAFSG
jgi:acetolactate synthase-1/2/3 large subunit